MTWRKTSTTKRRERAYGVYSGKYGRSQSHESLCERGGFHESALDDFVPGWHEEMAELATLRDQLATARSRAALSPAVRLSVSLMEMTEEEYEKLPEFAGR